MKILLANKFFFPKGGSEVVFFQERDFLINLGYKVIDFSMKHSNNLPSEYSDYFVSSVDYSNANKQSKLFNVFERLNTAINFVYNRKAVQRLTKLIQKEKPDIAHLHNIYHQLTPSIITVLKNAGIKVVLTLHDYKLVCPSYSMIKEGAICNKCEGTYFYSATINRCQDHSYLKGLLLSIEAYWHRIAKTYECVDLFLCPSKFIADMIARYRIESERIRILHNGIDLNKYNVSEEDEEYALYFGRLSTEKGVESLLRAHQLLSKKFPLKIVGTGPLSFELEAKYPEAVFVGYKTGEELKELVSRASFVIVPSECNENCSMSLLESMAYGKPAIGSRIGGIPEQIDDRKTGLLFEMGNTIDLAETMSLLVRNKDLRREMGKAAREKLEREYSLSAHCSKLLGIYKGLLSGC